MYSGRVRGYSSNAGGGQSGWSLMSPLGAPRLLLDDEEDLLPLHGVLVEDGHLDRAVLHELHVELALLVEVLREDAQVADAADAELAGLERDRLALREVDAGAELDVGDLVDLVERLQDAAGAQVLGEVGLVPHRVLLHGQLGAGLRRLGLGGVALPFELRDVRLERRLAPLELPDRLFELRQRVLELGLLALEIGGLGDRLVAL